VFTPHASAVDRSRVAHRPAVVSRPVGSPERVPPVFHVRLTIPVVKLSSYRSDSSVAGDGGGRASSTGSSCYPNDYHHRSGGKTAYRHAGRSKSAPKYVDDKPKKKKKSSASSASSNSVVSIPNTIKLSMLNSGLLPLCKFSRNNNIRVYYERNVTYKGGLANGWVHG
jgi:hypothetical protein